MENIEYDKKPQRFKRMFNKTLDILSVLFLLTALLIGVVSLVIYFNPQMGINPFPPPTMPVAISLPTSTPTPLIVLPPTWTPTVTSEPTMTSTPRPKATLPPTATPFSLVTPSSTMTGTTSTEGMPFVVAQGGPEAIPARPFHPDADCDWMGVAGQVLDITGAPISTGVQIWLGGTLAGMYLEIPSLTGTARQYGEAGYEIYLADHPIASDDTLWVQLLDQAGIPMSKKAYFKTYDDCEKNLIYINFVQVR